MLSALFATPWLLLIEAAIKTSSHRWMKLAILAHCLLSSSCYLNYGSQHLTRRPYV